MPRLLSFFFLQMSLFFKPAKPRVCAPLHAESQRGFFFVVCCCCFLNALLYVWMNRTQKSIESALSWLSLLPALAIHQGDKCGEEWQTQGSACARVLGGGENHVGTLRWDSSRPQLCGGPWNADSSLSLSLFLSLALFLTWWKMSFVQYIFFLVRLCLGHFFSLWAK